MAVHTFGWCRVEGAHVPDLGKRYGTFQNLPSTTMVFYGTVEVEIYHPNDTLNGIVYKAVPVSELCGLNTINEIDEHLPELREAIASYDKSTAPSGGSQYWYEAFAVSVPTVIFYAGSADQEYKNYTLLLADENAAPPIIAISAEYGGPSIPVGTAFAKTDLVVHAVYDDGQEALITHDDFEIAPADAIIHSTGSNVITIYYTTPEEQALSTTVVVPGVRNVASITARYDTGAPLLADGQTIERKYIIVVATFTDGTSATVTDYSFIDGGQVAVLAPGTGSNRSNPITVYYKGQTAEFTVPMYEVKSARLVAIYEGPDVEVGRQYLLDDVRVVIYYNGDAGTGGYHKNVDLNKCTFSEDTITKKGVNTIHVSAQSEKMGIVSTTMSIMGIESEVTVSFITAEYNGPEIYVGSSYSYEKVNVVVHYSDGAAIETANWSVDTNIVSNVGVNSYLITYREKGIDYTSSIAVMGLERDTTTESGYRPLTLDPNYPNATRMNNRFRGPAEAAKHRHFARALYDNLNNINSIFKDIENSYKETCDLIAESAGAKYSSLMAIEVIEAGTDACIHDNRFTTGEYVYKE